MARQEQLSLSTKAYQMDSGFIPRMRLILSHDSVRVLPTCCSVRKLDLVLDLVLRRYRGIPFEQNARLLVACAFRAEGTFDFFEFRRQKIHGSKPLASP